jgi:hypothetical protein
MQDMVSVFTRWPGSKRNLLNNSGEEKEAFAVAQIEAFVIGVRGVQRSSRNKPAA